MAVEESDGHVEKSVTRDDGSWQIPEPGHSELVQMRIRLVTLENIVLGLLSDATEKQVDQIRRRADMIEPRADATRHPLTELAADDMRKFLDRSQRILKVSRSSDAIIE
ncbi:MAG TPA: hypothetical protein DCX29_11415 [Hyphomonas sp.]|nr:hypothetical protein [Hyphomonas sp.]|tara:strand:- start:176 stop:502 length:327 start_codon:yes stop_codon:yes gene_type:complete